MRPLAISPQRPQIKMNPGDTTIDIIDEDSLPASTTLDLPVGGIASDLDGYQPGGNGNDGTPDEGKDSIPGVPVVITDSSNNTQTVTTDSDGEHEALVPPGSTIVDIEKGELPPTDYVGRDHIELGSSAHHEQDDRSETSSWDGRSNSEAAANKSIRFAITNGGDDDADVYVSNDMRTAGFSPEDDDSIPEVVVRPGRLLVMIFGCAKWSKARLRATILGCVSSILVLAIRLKLDIEPTAYLIHSIIVFLDMVLVHLFTNKMWLSISGELVTIALFLAFHFTKETVWELLETTVLAVLCSFNLINSRNEHMDHEKELAQDLNTLCRQTSHLLQHSDSGGLTRQESTRQLERMRSSIYNWNSDRTLEMEPEDNDHIRDLEVTESAHANKVKVWGEQFFEHFLDGSAGVMVSPFRPCI